MLGFCIRCGKFNILSNLCTACKEELKTEAEQKANRAQNSPAQKPQQKFQIKERYIQEAPSLTCIACGEPSGNYRFCKACYKKYREKKIAIIINNCQTFELTEFPPGTIKCKDGHMVRSQAEKRIDDYLFEHRIPHVYEKEIKIFGKHLTPDFYFPDTDTYMEYWGFGPNNEEYTNQKHYKQALYKAAGLNLIEIDYRTKDIESALDNVFFSEEENSEKEQKVEHKPQFIPQRFIQLKQKVEDESPNLAKGCLRFIIYSAIIAIVIAILASIN